MEREEYMTLVRNRVGDDTSDEALAFVDSMSRAYDEMANNDAAAEWERKYHENDEMWRNKYKERFFGEPIQPKVEPKKDPVNTDISIKDLFN